jgi:hypothetical protein
MDIYYRLSENINIISISDELKIHSIETKFGLFFLIFSYCNLIISLTLINYLIYIKNKYAFFILLYLNISTLDFLLSDTISIISLRILYLNYLFFFVDGAIIALLYVRTNKIKEKVVNLFDM